MAEEFVIAFEAGISSIDQSSLDEAAKQIRRSLTENTNFNVKLDQQSLTATVESLKLIGQEGDAVQRILAKVRVGDDVYNLKYMKEAEGEWQELPRTVSVSVKSIEKELKTLYDRATVLQRQLNNALKSNAEGFASFYQEALNEINKEITATEDRLAKAVANSGMLPIGTSKESSTAYAQKTSAELGTNYLSAMSTEDLSRQEGVVIRLSAAYRELLDVEKKIVTLQNSEGNNEILINQYTAQAEGIRSTIRALTGQSTAYRELTDAKEDEIATQKRLLQIQLQESNKQAQIQRILKEEEVALKKKIELEGKLQQVEYKMNSGPTSTLYRTKENKELVKTYQDEVRALNEKVMLLRKTADSLGAGAQATEVYEKAIKEQNLAIKEANALSSRNRSLTANIQAGLEGVVQRVASYTMVYGALYKIWEAAGMAAESIIELDKAFTDIRMVTQGTSEETYELASAYSDLAAQYGATTSQVASAATEFLRQGRSVEQTTELIKASLVLSKVGSIEAAEATTYLTSTMNGYQMSVEEAMHVVDALSAVDLKAATSVDELAKALQRSANSGREAGIGFERLVGYIGAVSEATRRAPETIGESLKTIVARFQNVKVGKSLDSFNQPLLTRGLVA